MMDFWWKVWSCCLPDAVYYAKRRTDSEVKVDLRMDLTKIEHFIKEQRTNNIPELTLYHFIFAALTRAALVTPEINRFIAKHRIYQREQVRISMIVKKNWPSTAKSLLFSQYLTLTIPLTILSVKLTKKPKKRSKI